MKRKNRSVFISSSPARTEEIAARLAAGLSGGLVVALAGELGAGKTVFVKGLARGLNVPPGVVVTSPTYVLQHNYRGGRLPLYHIDAYRLSGGAAEFEASGLNEGWDDPNAIVCIEWPERIADIEWPADHLKIALEHAGTHQRRITVEATGPHSEGLVAWLKTKVSRIRRTTPPHGA